MGNDQRSNGSSSSSSSKKNKSKSGGGGGSNSDSNSNSNLEKPKQPQRGLGVAQLEKIRLHTQMAGTGFMPQPHLGFPTSPFPSTLFPYVNDDTRIQNGYQASMQSSSTQFGYEPSSSQYDCHHPNSFMYVNDDTRIQNGYQASMQSSSTQFGYGHSSSQYECQHPNSFMMGVGEHMETTCNIRFGESHPSTTTRWNPNTNFVAVPENHQYIQPQGLVTRHLLSHVEEDQRDNVFISNGLVSQNSESSSENEEINLELKL